MKLAELKEEVYELWCSITSYKGVIAPTADFKADIRKEFGDLRRKSTWEKALARFYANIAHQSACLDAYSLMLYTFNFTPEHPEYEYRHQILDEFLSYKDGLELIRVGLEQLFTQCSAEERSEAVGFLQLARESSGCRSDLHLSEPARRQLAAAA